MDTFEFTAMAVLPQQSTSMGDRRCTVIQRAQKVKHKPGGAQGSVYETAAIGSTGNCGPFSTYIATRHFTQVIPHLYSPDSWPQVMKAMYRNHAYCC